MATSVPKGKGGNVLVRDRTSEESRMKHAVEASAGTYRIYRKNLNGESIKLSLGTAQIFLETKY